MDGVIDVLGQNSIHSRSNAYEDRLNNKRKKLQIVIHVSKRSHLLIIGETSHEISSSIKRKSQYVQRQNRIFSPSLCLHSLDLSHGLLERELKKFPPPHTLLLLPHCTLALVETLLE